MRSHLQTVVIFLTTAAALGTAALAQGQPASAPAAALGPLEGSADIGAVPKPGATKFDGGTKTFTLTGSGADIWSSADAFQFAYKKVSGDIALEADIAWQAGAPSPSSKAGVMFRQSLDANAPFADVVVHSDGHIGFQYRLVAGGPTQEIATSIKAPVTVLLERNAIGTTDGLGNANRVPGTPDVITASVKRPGGQFQEVGAMVVSMGNDIYAGLALTAHDPAGSATANFSNVALDSHVVTGARTRESTLEILDVDTGERHTVFREKNTFEAPNWSHDGTKLLINRHATGVAVGGARGNAQTLLFTAPVSNMTAFPLTADKLTKLASNGLTNINNDHNFSTNGTMVAFSANYAGNSKVFTMPAGGADAAEITQITMDGPSYMHGWSPDGKTIVFCGQRPIDNNIGDVYSIPSDGSGPEVRLTTNPDLDDGPEFSPDGQYIYYNSVNPSPAATALNKTQNPDPDLADKDADKRMKIWRMKPDGSEKTMISDDDATYNDWFGHISPDGKTIVMISFLNIPEGTDTAQRLAAGVYPAMQGVTAGKHPNDALVFLRSVPADAPPGTKPKIIATLYGGQGTINTPSWSPDSKHLALVSYRYVGQ